jgi:hypothetical protein
VGIGVGSVGNCIRRCLSRRSVSVKRAVRLARVIRGTIPIDSPQDCY